MRDETPYSAAYLEALGINPRDIQTTGWTDTTYELFHWTENGNLRRRDDDPSYVYTETRYWPSAFDADVLRYLRKKDGFRV